MINLLSLALLTAAYASSNCVSDGSFLLMGKSKMDVMNRIVARYDAIRSVSVTYTSNILQSPLSTTAGKQADTLKVFSAYGPFRYMEYKYDARIPVEVRYENETRAYYSGLYWNVYYPNGRLYRISYDTVLAVSRYKAVSDPYMESLGWWPPDDKTLPPSVSGGELYISRMLKKFKDGIIVINCKPSGELIIVVPFSDILVFKADTLELVSRHKYGVVTGKRTLLMEVLLSDYTAERALSLPKVVHRKLFSEVSGQLDVHMRYDLQDSVVNKPLLSQYIPVVEAGSIIHDQENDKYMVKGGDLEYARNYISTVQDVIKQYQPAVPENASLTFVNFFSFAVGCVSMFILLTLLSRTQRKGSNYAY